MSKHTPGPWVVEHNTAWNRDVDIRGCDGRQIAFAGSLNEADAKLIASAPDLLEACKLAMETIDAMLDVIGSKDCEPWSSDHNKEWQEFCNCYDALGAAKVKAVGDE